MDGTNNNSSNPNGNSGSNNSSDSPSPSSPSPSSSSSSSPRRKSSSPFFRSKRFSDNDDHHQDHYQQQQQLNEEKEKKKKEITIPPFYRPPGMYNSSGLKMQAIRRSRSEDSFDSDQSWDGIYSVDSNNSSSSADPAKENTDDGNTNNNNTSNANAANANKSNIPIKEQVKNIFEEHGKTFSPKLAQTQGQKHKLKAQSKLKLNQIQQHESKYLTIDQFVKITKDICNFPTFFNKPLYKRILYLWNTQDVKSTKGKLIIWNEYYLNSDELDIGIDPDDENGNGSNDNDGKNSDGDNKGQGGENNNSKEDGKKNTANKKKSNDLLDQLDKFITYDIFKWYWTQEMEDYDLSERFYRLLKKPHENYVAKDDFGPLINELLNDHPVSFLFSFLVLVLFDLLLAFNANKPSLHLCL